MDAIAGPPVRPAGARPYQPQAYTPSRTYGETYNPYYEPRRARFGTTPAELFHIFAAMVILALVLYLVFEGNTDFRKIRIMPIWAKVTAAFLISFLGFVLHELGHKLTAQHMGHWSEFRANWAGLALALAIAAWFHFPIALPGATWHNAHHKTDQGKISAMGPLVNYAVAVAALPFILGKRALDSEAEQLAAIVVAFSTVLALFNLIPIGALDGRKIFKWNPIVWVVMVLLGIGLLVASAPYFQNLF